MTTYCNNRPFARLVRVPQPRSRSSYRFLTRPGGGKRRDPGNHVASSFVLEVALCDLRPSIINSVSCDRIAQRAGPIYIISCKNSIHSHRKIASFQNKCELIHEAGHAMAPLQ